MPSTAMNGGNPKQQILDGARQAFLTFGYDGAGMRKITEYVGYSQAGIAHHFTNKAELLLSVFDQSCQRVMSAFDIDASMDPTSKVYRIWRNLTRVRDDIALRSVVLSEASTIDHPAAQASVDALASLREALVRLFPEVLSHDLYADAWEGIMIDWLYDPRLDVPFILKEGFLALSEPNDFPSQPGAAGMRPEDWVEEAPPIFAALDPYDDDEPEDPRRHKMLDAALQVFGDLGYVGGNLRTIASSLGITHPALLRHYPTKDDLLRAVLRHRDLVMSQQGVPDTPREAVLDGIRQTRTSLEIPGMTRLFVGFMTLSYQNGMPFHEFFARRRIAVNNVNRFIFNGLFEVGQIRPDLDPIAQGRLWSSVWDGSQIRWCLDNASTSVPQALTDYVNYVVVPPFSDAEIETTRVSLARD